MMIIPVCHLKNFAIISLELPAEVWSRLSSETDHELRAALICLLTAALAAQGNAAIIGEPTGGWFWLPPWSLWQHWATQGFRSRSSSDKKWVSNTSIASTAMSLPAFDVQGSLFESLGSIGAGLFSDQDEYKLFATKIWPLLAKSREELAECYTLDNGRPGVDR
jgi:hypothetical protein